MRVAYLAHLNLPPESGVAKKIFSQVRIWSETAEARLFILSRREDVCDLVESYGGRCSLYKGLPWSLDRLRALDRLITQILAWSPMAVYLRRDLFYPAYLRLAWAVPLVQEVNSDELEELRLYNRLQYLYHRLSRRWLDRLTDGWVFVTRELMRHPYYSRLPGAKIAIGNGIPLNTLPHLPPRSLEGPPRLVFIGQPAPWHGVDKVLRLAEAFPTWEVRLIGYEPSVSERLPGNVKAHGFLSFSQYVPILADADVGIGTLALHRKRMNEASPLKVREYLALGLPAIIGYEDTDFPDGAPFLLRLPNEERNIECCLEEIQRFVIAWVGKRVPRQEVAHLDLRHKERQRLAFIESVAKARRR